VPATTPVYGWLYQSLPDPPDGPNLGEDLALGIETTVQSLQSRIQQLEAYVAALQLNPVFYRARQTLTGTVASVTFDNIPSNLRTLEIFYTVQMNAGGAVALYARINNDSGATQYISTDWGSSAGAYAAVTNANGTPQGQVGTVTGNNVGAEFGAGRITFAGWDAPHASRLGWVSLSFAPASIAGGTFGRYQGGVYVGAAPYTRIDLFPSANLFSAGSDFQLVGMPA